MSASSPARVLVVTSSDIPLAELVAAERIVLIAEREGSEPLGGGVELARLKPGELHHRRLLELLVALSSGVDEIIVSCRALSYAPIAEAILAYTRIIDGLRTTIVGECCGEIPSLPDVECKRMITSPG